VFLPAGVFHVHEVQLGYGNLIVCVSDAVLEAQRGDGEIWDEANLESVLLEHRHAPVKDIADKLLEAVDAFVGAAEQFDDITIIVVRVAP
jgi:sigma-B regulation protein RsbU (phosphoserine phosphatase)